MGDIGGVAQAGASIASAGIQAGAINSAADKQYQSAQNALNLQQGEYDRQQNNIQPYLNTGYGALNQLNSDPSLTAGFSYDSSNLQNDPGYQFQLQQGLQALQRSQAATGITGGAAAKAAEQYGQGLAGTSYNTAYNRAFNTFEANQGNKRNTLLSLAGLGQTGVQQAGQAGANYANNASDITQNVGNVGAAQSIGIGNALSGGINGVANAASIYNQSSYGNQPDINTPTWNPATGQEEYPSR
jgi:hypothetical protein